MIWEIFLVITLIFSLGYFLARSALYAQVLIVVIFISYILEKRYPLQDIPLDNMFDYTLLIGVTLLFLLIFIPGWYMGQIDLKKLEELKTMKAEVKKKSEALEKESVEGQGGN